MTSPRRTTRQAVSLLIAAGVSVTLAACGDAQESTPASSSTQPQPSSPAATSAAPAVDYDIARVDNVKDDFPAGFNPQAEQAKTLSQADIDGSGINAFTGAQVDPPQCRSLIIPPYAEPSVGSQAAGIRGEGDQGNIDVVALKLPQPIKATPPPAGCDQVTLSGSPEASGTAQPVPAPTIAGVTTSAAKLSVNSGDDPDYVYTAALDDRTTVVVMGGTDPDLNPEQVMSDLLVKAVAAVRGQ
ncbi:DUF5642 family protein [Mycobacterium sp. pUA109]|uniref:DUF5642 family protein n=1 Tax=Mycobacterium sp. pUA109 TaxID=3238982 RepID=UPI00351B905F